MAESSYKTLKEEAHAVLIKPSNYYNLGVNDMKNLILFCYIFLAVAFASSLGLMVQAGQEYAPKGVGIFKSFLKGDELGSRVHFDHDAFPRGSYLAAVFEGTYTNFYRQEIAQVSVGVFNAKGKRIFNVISPLGLSFNSFGKEYYLQIQDEMTSKITSEIDDRLGDGIAMHKTCNSPQQSKQGDKPGLVADVIGGAMMAIPNLVLGLGQTLTKGLVDWSWLRLFYVDKLESASYTLVDFTAEYEPLTLNENEFELFLMVFSGYEAKGYLNSINLDVYRDSVESILKLMTPGPLNSCPPNK